MNGISGAVAAEASATTLGEGQIIDLKFLNDHSLLLLWDSEGKFLGAYFLSLCTTVRTKTPGC